MDTTPKSRPPAVSTSSLPVTYIVRLYRIDRERPALLTGTLESIDGRAPQSFRSAAELLALLAPQGPAPGAGGGKSDS